MKTLVKFALVAIVAILGYNYFFGDEKEQEQAERIVGKVKDLGADVKALVLNEKERYDEGKYDKTLEKFSELINSIQDKASNLEVKVLEEKYKNLRDDIARMGEKTGKAGEAQTEKVEREMEDLFDEIKEIVNDIEKEEF